MTTAGLAAGSDGRARCWWCAGDPAYEAYHDHEWGRPQVTEQDLFEKLSLDAFQAGLSWLLILRRRDALRAAFAEFDPVRLAAFDEGDITRLLGDATIVRNRAKIVATIGNARALQRLWDAGESLAELVWSIAEPAVPGRPRQAADVPAHTTAAAWLARELKARDFTFVGPTVVYAFCQAVGVVNDHLIGCHVRDAVEDERAPVLADLAS